MPIFPTLCPNHVSLTPCSTLAHGIHPINNIVIVDIRSPIFQTQFKISPLNIFKDKTIKLRLKRIYCT